ncbi:MAG: hypothetical protein U5K27_13730 [Desulfotignum sp.]|nr:hypothetical protein [Desulfotignum sp.]
MTSALFVMAAFNLFLCAFHGDKPEKSFYYAVACGVISGFSLGIRLDSILIPPCFMFAFFFLKPWRPRLCLWITAAAIPGLVLSECNKFCKIWCCCPVYLWPTRRKAFAGLAEIAKYFPLVFLFCAVFFLLWTFTRYSVHSTNTKKRTITGCILVSPAGILFMIPQVKNMIWNTLNGAYQLLVDFRIGDTGIKRRFSRLSRSEGGGMVYVGGLTKKSLLQSCPYLVMLVIPSL